MKKMICLLLVSFLCLQISGFSQNAKVGFTAGLTIANLHSKIDGVSNNGDAKYGYTAGLVVDAPINNNFSFMPSVNYVQKGKNEDRTNSSGVKEEIATQLRYIEVPFNFVYNVSAGGGFFIGAGPYISFGLPSQKVTTVAGAEAETDIKWGSTIAEDLRGMDYGANVIAGYKMKKGLFFSANYSQGLRNLATGDSNNEIKNTYFAISLGWLFND